MSARLYVGLDTHKNTVAVAVADDARNAEVRSYGVIDNTPAALAALLKTLGKPDVELYCCYEDGVIPARQLLFR